jgi:hypothetical protein
MGTDSVTALLELGIVVRADGREDQRVPCPKCAKGDRDGALSVNIVTGVFHCFRCDWKGKAGGRETGHSVDRVRSIEPRREADRERLKAIWRRTLPLRGTLGEIYLRHRRCALPPRDSDLRFLPGNEKYPPSLCALVTDVVTARPLTLHFTRLAADGRGKAGMDRDKVLLAGYPKAGGVIRLWPDEAVTHGLGIAEGIETALCAAYVYTHMWSTVDAGNMAKLQVLAGIESLVIFADHDTAGLKAARECAQRWHDAGREVCVLGSATVGRDIADEAAACDEVAA